MADEAIVVAARDEATAILKRIESQSVQLAGGVQQMAAKTVTASNRMSAAFAVLAVAGATITVIVGIVKALQGASSGLAAMASQGADAFNTQQAAVQGLNVALQGQVADVKASVASHVAFAAAVQVSTNVGDESTLGLMRQAAMMGVADSQLQSVTLASLGLAQALGISQEEALKKVTAATNGAAMSLTRLVPELRGAANEEEAFAMVMAIAQRGLVDAEMQTTTTAGAMARAAGATGDLQEKVGELISPFLKLGYEAVAVTAESLQTALVPAIDAVAAGFTTMKPMLDVIIGGFDNIGVIAGVAFEVIISVITAASDAVGLNKATFETWGEGLAYTIQAASEAVIGGMTWIEVILTNLPAVFNYVEMSFEAMAIGLVIAASEAFSQAIPEELSSFIGFMTEWINGLISGMQAGAMLLIDTLLAPWRALASLVPGLLEGINAAIDTATAGWGATVEIASVTIGSMPGAIEALRAREAELKAAMGGIATDLGTQFSEKFSERASRLNVKVRENLKNELDQIQTNKPTPDMAQLSTVQSQLSAVESRLLSRGRSDDPLLSVVENTRATVNEIKELAPNIAAALRQMLPASGNTLQVEMIA